MEILRKMMDQPYVEGAKKKGIRASIEKIDVCKRAMLVVRPLTLQAT
jgi:hypothetical protein